MAKGTDSNEFMVLSRVRTGLKREFAFAMKAQSEIDGSLGRTRGGSKNRNEGPVLETPVGKRVKKTGLDDVVMSEEEAKSDVVDLVSDEEVKNVERENGFLSKSDIDVKSDVVDEETLLKEEEEKVVIVNEIEMETVCEIKDETLEDKGTLLEEKGNVGGKRKKRVSLEKPVRRFTRSALKEKDEEIKDNDVVVGVDVDDVVVGVDERENGVSGVSPATVTPTPMKLGKSGKRFPVKLKDLLATGILEGLKVRYVKGQKARKPGEKDLQGVIKDSGILCFCGSCKGKQVVSPTVFELHAGSANKRPPEYTYLENGKLLRDVMNACSSLPLDTLDKVVQMVLGDFTMQNSNICFNCRGSISESNKGKSKLVCNPCMELKETQTSQLQTAATCSKSITTVVQPSQKMEEDDKNKASGKMISSTTDHHQKEGDDVAMNDSTFSLQLASSLNRTPKKRKEGPEAKTTSAGTSSKKRRGCALGFGSKNKREEGPSEKTTSAETSSKKIRGIT